MKKTIFAIILTIACIETQAQIIINELMQSNVDCIMDDLNEFPDSWVEIYNNSSEPVNLSEYKIGANDNADKAWALANKTLKAHAYLIVYCDKMNEETENPLHTDFRLESGKGAQVYLFKGSEIVDFVKGLKKQPAPNIAYGRKTDGADEWGYLLTPTPGASNCGQTTDNILGEPVFSQDGAVMTGGSFELTLSLPEGSPEGAEIRYTTDGSEPTASSTLYTAPISISITTTIRAKLFHPDCLSPRSTVHSYIYFPTDRELTLPVISIVTDNRYLYDSRIGIYVGGSYQRGKKNYLFDWRRPINIELFETSGQPSVINQLGEARIMGGQSRSYPLKSLVLYANKRFGAKRFDYEFFPAQRPGIKDFKSIMLRNAGNDFKYLYQRDAIIQRTVASHVDLDWQAYQPAIFYINGEYMGIINIRERSNEDNIYSNHGGLVDIDMVENWKELNEGSIDSFNEFKAFYSETDHTMEEYAERMDWEEFLNLMIMNVYYINTDFPGNNAKMWRPQAEGGKWRFVAKDNDYGLGYHDQDPNFQVFQWLYNPDFDPRYSWGANSTDATMLFRHMMEDEDLKREFIDRCAIYAGDFLNEQGTRAVWDPMYEMIKTELPYHRDLYTPEFAYDNELNSARDFLSKRTPYFYQQLKDFYLLGEICPMTVNQTLSDDDLNSIVFTFNGIKLSEGKFDGKFFKGRKVTLKGTPVNDKQVTGWIVRKTNTMGDTTETIINGAEYTFDMPACSQLTINAILSDATGIINIGTDTNTNANHCYTLDGRRVKHPSTGLYIINGKKILIK